MELYKILHTSYPLVANMEFFCITLIIDEWQLGSLTLSKIVSH